LPTTTEKRRYELVGGIDRAVMVLRENPYNVASYRADNKKLRVVLPGELHHQHMQKPREIRRKIEKKKLENYIEEI